MIAEGLLETTMAKLVPMGGIDGGIDSATLSLRDELIACYNNTKIHIIIWDNMHMICVRRR